MMMRKTWAIKMTDALSKRDLIRELWPHACPEKFWSGLFEALHLSTCSLVCIFTTSAHPGAMLAARAKGLQVHVLQDRVNQHCQGHGKQLADLAFRKLVKVQTQGIKRKLLASDLDDVLIEGRGLGFLYLVPCSVLIAFSNGGRSCCILSHCKMLFFVVEAQK